jgi:hypothetical protein
MKSIEEVERLLGQTPAPCVVEGPHREELKQRLLAQSQTAQPRRERMEISVLGRMSSMMKLAAALLLAAILIGTGWAGERIYKLVSGESPVFSHREPSGATSDFGTDAPNPTEKKKQVDEQIKQLIAEKRYTFVRRIDTPFGNTAYVYWFRLADGSRIKWKHPGPRLEEVASLDEYERKSDELAKQRKMNIEQAIAGGKGRLINFVLKETHVCRDLETNQKLDVCRGAPQCPEEGTVDFAYVYSGGVQEFEKPGDHVFMESTWPDHLKAIRDGRRELLDIRIAKYGIYEAVLENGAKIVFSRELPLQEKPEKK